MHSDSGTLLTRQSVRDTDRKADDITAEGVVWAVTIVVAFIGADAELSEVGHDHRPVRDCSRHYHRSPNRSLRLHRVLHMHR